ncbi:MAG: metallophosphoesterase [Clostridia bacterium]|nr:metallophosphoesterase [Clostridia bacterium]
MIYFTADTHFGHQNVIRFCNRPFSSAEEMDEALIENRNSRVRGNDTVYVLGDMFFRSTNVESILRRLRGKKRLIVGNHDSAWLAKGNAANFFASIDKFLEMSDGKRALTLCHYPMLSWKHAQRSYMIHGHIHNDRTADFWSLLVARKNVLNAGTDINGFMPVSFDELNENNFRFKSGETEA